MQSQLKPVNSRDHKNTTDQNLLSISNQNIIFEKQKCNSFTFNIVCCFIMEQVLMLRV